MGIAGKRGQDLRHDYELMQMLRELAQGQALYGVAGDKSMEGTRFVLKSFVVLLGLREAMGKVL